MANIAKITAEINSPSINEVVESWEEASQSATHRAALAYAAAGIPIFPCVADGKAPACAHGYKDATTDVEQINAWWAEESFNVGLCPEDAGWCVIDIDPGAVRPEFPETYEVRTPRGGAHLYYSGSLPPTVNKLGDKIDTRGRHSYVLVPPSAVNGKPYTLLHDRDLAELPSEIAETLADRHEAAKAAVDDLDAPQNIERAQAHLQSLVERGDIARSGQGGNCRTYKLACEMQGLGLSPDECRKQIEELWNPHCIPPWSHDELARLVENATQYMQNEPGAFGVEPAARVFETAVSNLPAIPEPVDVRAPKKINLINPIPFSTLMSRPLKPIQEI